MLLLYRPTSRLFRRPALAVDSVDFCCPDMARAWENHFVGFQDRCLCIYSVTEFAWAPDAVFSMPITHCPWCQAAIEVRELTCSPG